MKIFKKEISNHALMYGGLITTFAFLYVATAFVSWYHAITFFNIANAIWLSFILSLVAEVGQASALFSLLLTENKTKWLTWVVMVILTALQVVGNVDSSYDWISKHGEGVESFRKSILFWVQTENNDMFKVIIAWITGALLPIIALSMTALVAQNLELKSQDAKTKLDNDKNPEDKVKESKASIIDAKDIISEVSKIRPTQEDLEKLENLLKDKKPIEKVPPEEKITNIDVPLFKSPEVFTTEREINEKPSIDQILADLTPEAKEYLKTKLIGDISTSEQLANEEVGSYLNEDAAILIPENSVGEQERIAPTNEVNAPDYLSPEVQKERLESLVKESQSEPLEVVIGHTNGLVEAVEVSPPVQDSSEEEKKRIEEERLERIRAAARENSKKK